MLTRIATGLVLAPLLVWLLLGGPLWLVGVIIALAAAQSARELLLMWPQVDTTTRRLAISGVFVAALMPVVSTIATLPVLGIVATLLLSNGLRKTDDLAAQARIGALALLAVGYVGAMGAALTAIAAITSSAEPIQGVSVGQTVLLGHFLVVFSGDTGAYFAGKSFGRHKLYPAVSPKKTVEGGIGGLLLGAVTLPLYCHWMLPALPTWQVVAAAICLGMIAQVGDFAESLFKRATDTKDSGALLPGHGGMLDRIDGVLFAAPWTLALLLLR
jgi:phosphatidate cytidylyltransferase